jgi:hypothetical protein
MITETVDIASQKLQCPECGNSHMHQQRVDVYSRNGEDHDIGIHASVDYNSHNAGGGAGGESAEVCVDEDVGTGDGNPSTRRDGIVIQFQCEHCHGLEGYHELVISQHKGQEYVFWRGEDESE